MGTLSGGSVGHHERAACLRSPVSASLPSSSIKSPLRERTPDHNTSTPHRPNLVPEAWSFAAQCEALMTAAHSSAHASPLASSAGAPASAQKTPVDESKHTNGGASGRGQAPYPLASAESLAQLDAQLRLSQTE